MMSLSNPSECGLEAAVEVALNYLLDCSFASSRLRALRSLSSILFFCCAGVSSSSSKWIAERLQLKSAAGGAAEDILFECALSLKASNSLDRSSDKSIAEGAARVFETTGTVGGLVKAFCDFVRPFCVIDCLICSFLRTLSSLDSYSFA